MVWVYLPTATGPFVCHSPSPNKRKLFCLFVCRGTLSYYGLGAFSLPIPYGMHLVVLTQLYFFWVVCHPNRTLSLKELEHEPQNRSFPSPYRQTMPLTFDPWLHLVLYWLGTYWWGLGLARAFLPCMSKICLLLMRLPWLACTVCRPFFTIFWFAFLLWLALLRGWALLDGGLCFSSAHHFFCYHLLTYYFIIPATKLFTSILLGLFGPAIYSSPMAQYSH